MSAPKKRPEMKGKKKQQGPSRREEGLKTTQEMMTLARSRAQKVFLQLVEETVSPSTFTKFVRYINPEIYEHIVLDRGASSICGYPLCPNSFTDFYGEKMYKIKNNKVYDITMRRNFCSGVCYEASEIVMRQISLEPLYVRESRPDIISNVEIPSLDNLQGLPGKFVDISGGLYTTNIQNDMKSRPFTSFTEVAEDSLKMCAENKEVLDGADETKKSNFGSGGKKTSKKSQKGSKQEEIPNASKNAKDKGTGMESTEAVTNHQEEGVCNAKKEGSNTLNAILQIEQALREWMTFDSLRFILGDKYIRGMLEDLGKNWEDFDTTAGMKLGVEAKAKYIALCRKLDEEERNEDSGPNLEGHSASNKAQKPLPDYKQLQEDAKKQQLKVVSFLGGNDQYEDLTSEKNMEADEDAYKTSLPLIDSYAQVEWRQSIVLDKFDKYLKPFLPLTKLHESEVKRLIKDLVLTFDFTPSNIIFKPGQWSLITLLILKLLSIRYSAVHYGLQRVEFSDFKATLLSAFNLDVAYLDRFVSYATEIKHIIRKSDANEETPAAEARSSGNSPSFEEKRLAESIMKMSVNCEAESKTKSGLDATRKSLEVSDIVSLSVNKVSSATEELD